MLSLLFNQLQQEQKSKMRFIILSLLCVTLIGCTSYHTETIDYGLFYLEQDRHVSSSPLRVHSPTGLDAERICSRSIDFCLESKRINVKTGYFNNKIIMVSFEGENYFLDAVTGTQLKCLNCSNKKFQEEGIVLSLVLSLVWSEAPGKVFFYYSKNNKIYSALLEYYSEGVIWTDIDISENQSDGIVGELQFYDHDNVIAWYYCDPSCDLVQYNIVTKQYVRQITPCTNIKNLTHTWQEESVKPLHHSSAAQPHSQSDGGVCVNNKGQPYFPIITGDYYNFQNEKLKERLNQIRTEQITGKVEGHPH